MADDPVRAAFRSELATIKTAGSIAWETKDVENVYAAADGLTSFLALEFVPAGPARRMSVGNPGNDYFDERGTVYVRLVAPLNAGRATIEDYAAKVYAAFRGRIFQTQSGQKIYCDAMPAAAVEQGARWVSTVSVAYRTQTRG